MKNLKKLENYLNECEVKEVNFGETPELEKKDKNNLKEIFKILSKT